MKDDYQEHLFHNTYVESCSECFKENRMMKAHQMVNKRHEVMLEDYPAFRNSWGDNYPLGYIPE